MDKKIIVTPTTKKLLNLFRQYGKWQSELISLAETLGVNDGVVDASCALHQELVAVIGNVVGENVCDESDDENILI